MRFLILLMSLLFPFFSLAQAPTSTAAVQCPTCPECPSCARGNTEVYRDDSFGTLMVGYQYLNTWVIGKQTASYTQIFNRAWSMEVEYVTSERDVKLLGVDLGTIQEDRYTLFAKYYVGNSFHVSFGPYMSDITIDLSDSTLRDILGNKINETAEIETYGVAAGFGSRWQTKWGLTWGVDWFRINAPVKVGKVKRQKINLDEDEDAEFKNSFSIFRTIPAFTFVGVNVGYTF